jgi:hypothetical protein
VTVRVPTGRHHYGAQQTSSEYAHASGTVWPLHVATAAGRHVPPASLQPGRVSAGEKHDAWQVP